METVVYETEPDVRVLVHSQRPTGDPKGELILVHGLEGSSASGYARSMVHAALERGWVTHRFNMRGCGGADDLAVTGYHAGQTSDLLAFLRERRRASSSADLRDRILAGRKCDPQAGGGAGRERAESC